MKICSILGGFGGHLSFKIVSKSTPNFSSIFGSFFRAFWLHFESLWGALGGPLASFGRLWGVIWRPLGAIWGCLWHALGKGRSGRVPGSGLGGIWEPFGAIWEVFWSPLGAFGPHLGGLLELLGRYLGALCNKSCKLKLQARALSKTGKLERKAGVHGSS